ncbi:MAG: helix-turn-helix domain-containing protein [Paludibacteraceae bacterium]|nr:helix-turn-helix domain-containing protein [Paludibacteraceae bacterium]
MNCALAAPLFQTLSPFGGLGFDGIRTFYQDTDGFIWVVMREDVFRYDGYEYISYANRLSGAADSTTLFFRGIEEEDNRLLLITSHGEYAYEAACDSFVMVHPVSRLVHTVNDEVRNNSVYRTSLTTADGREWVGTQSGLLYRDTTTQDWIRCAREDERGLVNNSIWTLYADRDNNMWIGTYSGGVSFYPAHTGTPFYTARLADYGLPQCAVSSFVLDGETLWLGTEGAGLLELRREDHRWQLVKAYTHKDGVNSLAYNNINTLLKHGNQLWIGMYIGGLDCFDLRTRTFRHFRASDRNDLIVDNHLTKMVPAGDSAMWIIYPRSKQQLTYVDLRTEQAQHIDVAFSESGYEYRHFVDAASADSGLFLATDAHLFYMGQDIHCLYHVASIVGPVSSLYVDEASHELWVGTQKRGVSVYRFAYDFTHNSVTIDSVRTYTSFLQYDDPTVYSIIRDRNNHLWMGTDKGLIRYTPASDRTALFDATDNLQSSTFFPRAVAMSADGELFFGGNEGFSSLLADQVQLNPVEPRVLLSEHPLTPRIRYQDNTISFTLACTNFYKSSKNRYRYRLVGANSSWQETDSRHRTITYSHLPIGHYRFEVCAANNDGVWGETYTYRFRIMPAWWNGWWAWLVYALLACVVLYILANLWVRHKRVQTQLYAEQLRAQEAEKASRAKVRFFTDVNRELKAPLLQLQSVVDPQQTAYVAQMLQIIDKYSDMYCIDTGKDRKAQQIDRQLDKLTRLISERMAEHISIDELAREMGMSRRKLFSFVKDNTGKSIIEYIRAYRLSCAAKLLLEQNLTTLQVMEKVGIESQSYFVKAFKEEFGDTPTDFLAKMSKKNAQ